MSSAIDESTLVFLRGGNVGLYVRHAMKLKDTAEAVPERNGYLIVALMIYQPSCSHDLSPAAVLYLVASVDKYLSRTSRIMVMLNGFSKISAAPACRAWFLTVNSGKAVVMITGMFRVAGFAFKRAIILSPITSGKYISIRIKSGCISNVLPIASLPEPGSITS
jgi:hypothetical protein